MCRRSLETLVKITKKLITCTNQLDLSFSSVKETYSSWCFVVLSYFTVPTDLIIEHWENAHLVEKVVEPSYSFWEKAPIPSVL